MSALLGLREWLSLDDAVRYVEFKGLAASKVDLLLSYKEFEYPLQILNVYLANGFEDEFPFALDAKLGNDGPYYDGEVEMIWAYRPVDVKYGKSDLSIVKVITSHENPSSVPVYDFEFDGLLGPEFVLVDWKRCTDALSSKVFLRKADLDQLLEEATVGAGKEEGRNWPLIAGALLNLLTKSGKRNKSGIITEIVDTKIHGLGKRTLDGALAEASRVYEEKAGG